MRELADQSSFLPATLHSAPITRFCPPPTTRHPFLPMAAEKKIAQAHFTEKTHAPNAYPVAIGGRVR
jgi:hypothetical protein